jgi:hypothetical protein
MKQMELFEQIKSTFDGELCTDNGYKWQYEITKKKELIFVIAFIFEGDHVELKLVKKYPGLLDGKYPCYLNKLLKRFELVKGLDGSHVWVDYFNMKEDSNVHIEDKKKCYYPIPKTIPKQFYKDAEIIALIDQLKKKIRLNVENQYKQQHNKWTQKLKRKENWIGIRTKRNPSKVPIQMPWITRKICASKPSN